MKKGNRLPQEIRHLRENLNLNQADFAAKFGVTAMSVSRWEGATNEPPAECIVKMGIMSGSPQLFWFFLGRIGLTKRDCGGR